MNTNGFTEQASIRRSRGKTALAIALGGAATLSFASIIGLPLVLDALAGRLSSDGQLSGSGVAFVIVQLIVTTAGLAASAWAVSRPNAEFAFWRNDVDTTFAAVAAALSLETLIAGKLISPRTDLLVEDGLIENTQVAILALAAVLLVVAARRAARRRDRIATAALVLFTAAVVVLIGEEVSWGQRIFGWSTPDAWRELNTQNETNIHNTFEFIQVTRFFPIIAVAAVWYGVVAGVAGLQSRLNTLLPKSELVVPAISLLLAGYAFELKRLHQEITELQLVLFILLYAWYQSRHQKRLRDQTSSPLGSVTSTET